MLNQLPLDREPPLGSSTVALRVLQAARRSPHSIAVESGNKSWSYAELAAQITTLFETMPSFKEVPVLAIHGSPSFEFIAALTATMLRGAVAMPIDESLPSLRKRQMLDISGAAGVIDLANIESETALPLPIWRIDASGTLDPAIQNLAPPPGALPRAEYDDAAYLFLTSGTTGAPKAVLGRASSLDHFVGWQRNAFEVDANDRIGQLTTVSFDPCLREIFVALTSGARLQIPPPGARGSSTRIREFIAQSGTTIVHVVPTLVRHWLREGHLTHEALQSLRLTIFAGEPLVGELVRAWREVARRTEVVNFYGPTETTLARFYLRIPEQCDPSEYADPLPVGFAIDSTRAVVVSEDNKEVERGDVGEILIDTAFPSYGYLDKQANAEKFVTLPGLETLYGQRFYRSGDRGYTNSRGELVVLGRCDSQVKVGGVRINPNEVAACMRGAPAVVDAVVCARHDEQGTRLFGWYIPSEDGSTSAEELRAYLAQRLVPAMIPSRITPISSFPFTSNGKVDTAKLLAEIANIAPSTKLPKTPSEKKMCELWADVLGVPRVGPDDDFYALGGDSLQATELASRLARRELVSIDEGAVLEHRTPERLSAALDAGVFPPASSFRLRQGSKKRRIARLSSRQRAYRAVCMVSETSTWCILSRLIELPSHVEEDQIKGALKTLVVKHDALRMRFGDLEQTDEFEIQAPSECDIDNIPLPTVDLTSRDYASSRDHVAKLRAAGSKQEFGPSCWPLFRVTRLRFSDRDALLLWVHHIIMDGPSLNLVTDELLNELTLPPSEAKSAASQVASYVDYLEYCAQEEPKSFHDARDYWRDLLRGVEPTSLPEDRSRRASAEGMLFTQPFPPHLVKGVHAHAQASGCTPFVLLLGAFLRAVAKEVKRSALCVIVPAQVRPNEFSRTVGMFASSLVLHAETLRIGASDMGWSHDLAQQIRDGKRFAAYEFDERLTDAGIPNRQYDFPLTTLIFNLNAVSSANGFAAATPFGHHSLGRDLRFQLQGEVQQRGNEFLISYLYRAGVFDRAGIERFAHSVEQETAALIDRQKAAL